LGVYQPSLQGGDSSDIAKYNQRVLKIADHFIGKGVDINKIDEKDGLSALHKEVLANNSKLVRYLVDKGVDLSIKENNNNLTPLQFVELLVTKNNNIDRSEVWSLLKK
jgi:ankyrin repeat protein